MRFLPARFEPKKPLQTRRKLVVNVISFASIEIINSGGFDISSFAKLLSSCPRKIVQKATTKKTIKWIAGDTGLSITTFDWSSNVYFLAWSCLTS
jgi:hypothetical protein